MTYSILGDTCLEAEASSAFVLHKTCRQFCRIAGEATLLRGQYAQDQHNMGEDMANNIRRFTG